MNGRFESQRGRNMCGQGHEIVWAGLLLRPTEQVFAQRCPREVELGDFLVAPFGEIDEDTCSFWIRQTIQESR